MLNEQLENYSVDYKSDEVIKLNEMHSTDDVGTIKDGTFTYNEATDEIGRGKFHIFILGICGLCLLGVVTEGMNMGLALPSAKCDISITIKEQGIIASIGFIGIFMSSHFWGLLADTWGRHKVLRVTSICSFIMSAISSFSISVPMILITRFFVGFFISGVQASSISYLGEFHSDKTRKKTVTIAAMFMTLSVFYMGSMGLIIIPTTLQFQIFGFQYSSWRLYILCSSLTNAIVFVALLFLPESPKFLLIMGKEEQAIEVLRKVYHINTGNSKESFRVKHILLDDHGKDISNTKGFIEVAKLAWNQTWPLLVPPHILNTLMLCYLMFVFYLVAHGTVLWIPGILTEMTKHMDQSNTVCDIIALGLVYNKNSTSSSSSSSASQSLNCIPSNVETFQIFIVIGISLMAIFILFAFLVTRFKLKVLLCVWTGISAIMSFALVWANNFYLIIILFTIMVSSGNIGSALSAISADLYPTSIKAMALCLILMIGRSGAVAGSNIVAGFFSFYCDGLFYFCGLVLISCIIILLILFRKQSSANIL